MEDLPEDIQPLLDKFFTYQMQKLQEFGYELNFQRCIHNGLLRQGAEWEHKPNTLANRTFYDAICNQILKTSKHIATMIESEHSRIVADKEVFRDNL